MIISTLELEQPYRGQLDELTGGQVRHTRLDQLSENELRSVEILFTYGYDIPEATLRREVILRSVAFPPSKLWAVFSIRCCAVMISPQTEQCVPAVRPVAVQLAGIAGSVISVCASFSTTA